MPEIPLSLSAPAAKRIRDGASLLVLPVEPPLPGEWDFIAPDNNDPPQLWTWCGPQDESAEPWTRITPPCRPGDVLLVEWTRHFDWLHSVVTIRFPVGAVECKRLADLTWHDWTAMGFGPSPGRHYVFTRAAIALDRMTCETRTKRAWAAEHGQWDGERYVWLIRRTTD